MFDGIDARTLAEAMRRAVAYLAALGALPFLPLLLMLPPSQRVVAMRRGRDVA